jgi:putative ABC transport system substrate-binding protein
MRAATAGSRRLEGALARMSRAMLAVACIALLAAAGVADAQRSRTWRVGFLHVGTLGSPEMNVAIEHVRRGLADRGLVEGRNLVIEYRVAGGRIERLDKLAGELVGLEVDLIFAVATPAARAARRATSTIPIVAAAMGDPVGDRLVTSLARPGANLTGTTFWGPKLVPKHIELVREMLPNASDVAVLWHRGAYVEDTMRAMRNEAEAAAREAGLRLHFAAVRGPDDFDAAFAELASVRPAAIVVFPSPMLFAERRRIVAFAGQHRVPAIFNSREAAELGALMAYGPDLGDVLYHSTHYVERILNGARPGDLPVEQPVRLEFVVNRRAAKALGIDVPRTLLVRADRIVD